MSNRSLTTSFLVLYVVLFAEANSRLSQAGDAPFRRHVIHAESTYSACAAMDVNRDGVPDIVAGGLWYAGPRFKPRRLREVQAIRGRYDDYSNLPLDVNGDGWTDLVSVNYRSESLYWVEHPGESLGAWKKHTIDKPGASETGRLVDVDGDGRLDVLPNGVRYAAWYELVPGDKQANSAPKWIRHELPRQLAGHGIGFGDIDGDGRNDLVGPRGWLAAPEKPRTERWPWHPEFDLGRGASIPILVLDVDGDGDADLVWGRGHGIGLYWLEQFATENGERRWRQHAIDTSWSQPHALLLADLDGDGIPEVVAGKRYMGHEGKDPGEYDPLVVYRYQFDPKRRTWRRWLVNWDASVGFGLDPKAEDIDADGDLDLICPGRSGLYLLENLRMAEEGLSKATSVLPETPAYEDHSRLLVLRTPGGEERKISTPAEWARRRVHILAGMQQAMGPLPDPSRRVPLDVKYHGDPEKVEPETAGGGKKAAGKAGYVRYRIEYAAEPGDRVPAHLLVPARLSKPAPAMLCLHQTTGIGKDEPAGLGGRQNLHYAHELAQRGYVCLVPDYPSFGDYAYDFAAQGELYDSGSMKAIWNNIRGVDLLETLPEVDRRRIGVIGHSLGGHNALFTAAFDQRIRAVVTSCGFTAFHHYKGSNLAGWTSERYMPRIRTQFENDPDRVPFDFYGTRVVVARKDGYRPLRREVPLDPPWYQYPPFDLFADLLWPGTIEDVHRVDLALERRPPPPTPEAIEAGARSFGSEAR